MIRRFSFIFTCIFLAMVPIIQAQGFSTDVELIEDALLKNTFQGVVGTCEYREEGFWQGCRVNVWDDAIFGSFSRVGVKEIYLGTGRDCGGCFFGNLLREEDGEWMLVKDHVGYFGNACLKFTTLEQRDLLTCYVNGRAEMDPSVEIWALDFSKAEPKITLLYFEHPWIKGGLCGQIARGAETVIYYEPINWMPIDFDADGDKDLYFVLDTVEITQKHCTNETIEDETLIKTLPRIRKDLIWLLDGETFTPIPETEMFLETLQPQ